MAIEDTGYLVHYTNEIHQLLVRARLFSSEEPKLIAQASRFSCDVFEELVSQKQFLGSYEELLANTREDGAHGYGSYRVEFLNLLNSDSAFERFLKDEYELLVRSGLRPDIVADLIYQCRTVLPEVRQGTRDVDDLREVLLSLKDEVCRLADDQREKLMNPELVSGCRERLGQIVVGIGGAAMVVVNSGLLHSVTFQPFVDVVTFQMGASLSNVLGGAILGNALPKSAARSN